MVQPEPSLTSGKQELFESLVNKILVTEKERDDNFDVVKIVQDYVIEIGSEFYCSEKKANCLVEGFEPYDYREDLELNIMELY